MVIQLEKDARVNILSCFVHVARSVLVCACVCGGGACNERKPLRQLQHLCNSCNTSATALASGRTSNFHKNCEIFEAMLYEALHAMLQKNTKKIQALLHDILKKNAKRCDMTFCIDRYHSSICY